VAHLAGHERNVTHEVVGVAVPHAVGGPRYDVRRAIGKIEGGAAQGADRAVEVFLGQASKPRFGTGA
jgi:hypothetical protein